MSFQLQVNIYSEPVNFLEELGSSLFCIVETTPLWKVDEGDSKKNLYEHECQLLFSI